MPTQVSGFVTRLEFHSFQSGPGPISKRTQSLSVMMYCLELSVKYIIIQYIVSYYPLSSAYCLMSRIKSRVGISVSFQELGNIKSIQSPQLGSRPNCVLNNFIKKIPGLYSTVSCKCSFIVVCCSKRKFNEARISECNIYKTWYLLITLRALHERFSKWVTAPNSIYSGLNSRPT